MSLAPGCFSISLTLAAARLRRLLLLLTSGLPVSLSLLLHLLLPRLVLLLLLTSGLSLLLHLLLPRLILLGSLLPGLSALIGLLRGLSLLLLRLRLGLSLLLLTGSQSLFTPSARLRILGGLLLGSLGLCLVGRLLIGSTLRHLSVYALLVAGLLLELSELTPGWPVAIHVYFRE